MRRRHFQQTIYSGFMHITACMFFTSLISNLFRFVTTGLLDFQAVHSSTYMTACRPVQRLFSTAHPALQPTVPALAMVWQGHGVED